MGDNGRYLGLKIKMKDSVCLNADRYQLPGWLLCNEAGNQANIRVLLQSWDCTWVYSFKHNGAQPRVYNRKEGRVSHSSIVQCNSKVMTIFMRVQLTRGGAMGTVTKCGHCTAHQSVVSKCALHVYAN